MMLKCLVEYNLQYCGDSIEWCPVVSYQHLFVCGSYQLEPDSSQRVGRIDLFSYRDSKLDHLQGINLDSGLLDAKWVPNTPNCALLAAALSSGTINIYKLEGIELRLVTSTEVCCNGMALSIDWSTGVKSDSEPKLVVSRSDGSISLLQLTEKGSLSILSTFKAHDYEAWIGAFNYWDTNIIYTGGDDCKLHVFDTRKYPIKPVHTDTSHGVGITSIQCNQKFQGYIASGSYEDVRTWKTSNLAIECVDKEEMSGGSWRVKWNVAGDCKKIAVAAMHNGFSIIDYSHSKQCTTNKDDICDKLEQTSLANDSKINTSLFDIKKDCKKNICAYKEPHNSLGYGIDWSFENNNILATCSFYDKKLSVTQYI